jgi:hypothetical protein
MKLEVYSTCRIYWSMPSVGFEVASNLQKGPGYGRWFHVKLWLLFVHLGLSVSGPVGEELSDEE